jgi:hypothetical protein
VFASAFLVVLVSASTVDLAMATVVAMPAAFGVSAWLQVLHRNFFRRHFVHIAFLQ